MKIAEKIFLFLISTRLNLISLFSKKRAAFLALQLFCTPRRDRKKASSIFKKAEELEFVLEGHRIRGYRWNRGGHPRLLILHGFESSAANFDHFVSPFLKLGFEVLVFDAPAHGKSDGKQISLPLYKGMIQAADEKFGPFQSFLSHSYGGLALAHYLETLEDSTHIQAVLIAPATETVTAINSFFKLLRLNERIRPAFDQLIYESSGLWPKNLSIRRAMQHIKARTLWIHDEEDQVTPVSDALKLKEDNHPNIEFYLTRGLGHSRIYRDNQVKRKVLEFFSSERIPEGN